MVHFIHVKNLDDFDNWKGSPGTGDKTDEDSGYTGNSDDSHDHDHDHDHAHDESEVGTVVRD